MHEQKLAPPVNKIIESNKMGLYDQQAIQFDREHNQVSQSYDQKRLHHEGKYSHDVQMYKQTSNTINPGEHLQLSYTQERLHSVDPNLMQYTHELTQTKSSSKSQNNNEINDDALNVCAREKRVLFDEYRMDMPVLSLQIQAYRPRSSMPRQRKLKRTERESFESSEQNRESDVSFRNKSEMNQAKMRSLSRNTDKVKYAPPKYRNGLNITSKCLEQVNLL